MRRILASFLLACGLFAAQNTPAPPPPTPTVPGISAELLKALMTLFGGLFGSMDIAKENTQILNKIILGDQLLEAVRQTAQMIRTHNFMVWQSQMIGSKWGRWAVPLPIWRGTGAADTYGQNGGWLGAVNSGMNAATAYYAMIDPLNRYSGGALFNVPPSVRARLYRQYGALERLDGSAIRVLAMIGERRAGMARMLQATADLQQATLSDDPDANTEVAVLNKINAANQIALQAALSGNELSDAAVERQMLQMLREREIEATAINADIEFRTLAPAYAAQHTTGTTQAYRNIRIP